MVRGQRDLDTTGKYFFYQCAQERVGDGVVTYRVPCLDMLVTVPESLGPIVDDRVRHEAIAAGAPAVVLRVSRPVQDGVDGQGRSVSPVVLAMARGTPGSEDHPLCTIRRGGGGGGGVSGGEGGATAAASGTPLPAPAQQEAHHTAELEGPPGETPRARWRRRGEAALAVDFLKTRASTPDHPLDVAERYQQEEGFDDLLDACQALVESLEAFERDRAAHMTDAELENLRQLVDILREQKGQSQMLEEEEAAEEQQVGPAHPPPSLWEDADSPPSRSYWEPVCHSGPVAPGPGLDLYPEGGGGGTGTEEGGVWVPKVRATTLWGTGPHPALPQVRAELGSGPPLGRTDVSALSGKAHRSAGALGSSDGGTGEVLTRVMADITFNLDIGNKRAEESSAGKVGTLTSVSKDHELLVLSARGCGRFRVEVCPDELGRPLVKALLRAAEHSAALFKHHRWPTLINYRMAYGLATGSWGGKTVEAMHPHSLGVADWVTCAEELFDDYVPSAEYEIEPRPKQPLDMLRWAKQARNGIRVVCLMYGAEHKEERSEALDYLIRLHEDRPRKYTAKYVQDAWEELNARWWEELRWKVKEVQRFCNKELVRKEDFIFAALTPTPGGTPLSGIAYDVRGGGPRRVLPHGDLRTPGEDCGERLQGERPPGPATPTGGGRYRTCRRGGGAGEPATSTRRGRRRKERTRWRDEGRGRQGQAPEAPSRGPHFGGGFRVRQAGSHRREGEAQVLGRRLP